MGLELNFNFFSFVDLLVLPVSGPVLVHGGKKGPVHGSSSSFVCSCDENQKFGVSKKHPGAALFCVYRPRGCMCNSQIFIKEKICNSYNPERSNSQIDYNINCPILKLTTRIKLFNF
jgi:hypothetical protein